MRKEQEHRLCTEFPLLYRDRYASMEDTCMCWGFSCGPGWYDLLYTLSSKLEPLIREWVDAQPKDLPCVCGDARWQHLRGSGPNMEISRRSLMPHGWPTLCRWRHFSMPCSIYDSKKVKDRLYVKWRRVKSWASSRLNRKVTKFYQKLCDWGIAYDLVPHPCNAFKPAHPTASQVKEKYGTLRFYMARGTAGMHEHIVEAENRSARTCEECGRPGTLRARGWVVTLCDSCEEAQARGDDE